MPDFEKCDGILVSALLTQFAGYDQSSAQVHLLIELDASDVRNAISNLKSISGAHGALITPAHAVANSPFHTGSGSLEWLEALQREPSVVRLGLANQLKPFRAAARSNVKAPLLVDQQQTSLGSVLLGVIDHGCPFAHPDLIAENGETRILSMWDQDEVPEFNPSFSFVPRNFGYGAQVNRSDLNRLINKHPGSVDESEIYRQLAYASMRHSVTHGSMCVGLIAGRKISRSLTPKHHSSIPSLNAEAPTGVAASSSDIVFVQLPRPALLAPSSGAMNRSILDGIQFIISQAGSDTTRIVICITYGNLMGPHDGSSIIEKAMDHLVKRSRRKGLDLKLVFASGNAAEKPIHAQVKKIAEKSTIKDKYFESLFWMVPPDLQANTALEMWLKPPTGIVVFKLATTDGGVYEHTFNAQTPVISQYTGQPIIIKTRGVNAGVLTIFYDALQRQYLVMVTLVPALNNGSSSAVLAGRWKIELLSATQQVIDANVYVGWGGRNLGFQQRVQPTRLVKNSSAIGITAEGSLLGTACGLETYAIGACHNAPNFGRTKYSGGGKPRGGGKSRASALALAEESVWLPGIVCLGTRSATQARVNGTSVAAPQAARLLANEGMLRYKDRGAGRLISKPYSGNEKDFDEQPIDTQ
jgi:hypothetical protein